MSVTARELLLPARSHHTHPNFTVAACSFSCCQGHWCCWDDLEITSTGKRNIITSIRWKSSHLHPPFPTSCGKSQIKRTERIFGNVLDLVSFVIPVLTTKIKEGRGMVDFRTAVSNSSIYILTLLWIIFREIWILNRLEWIIYYFGRNGSERIGYIIQNSLFFSVTIIWSHLSNFPKVVWINLASIQKGNLWFCLSGSWELGILSPPSPTSLTVLTPRVTTTSLGPKFSTFSFLLLPPWYMMILLYIDMQKSCIYCILCQRKYILLSKAVRKDATFSELRFKFLVISSQQLWLEILTGRSFIEEWIVNYFLPLKKY